MRKVLKIRISIYTFSAHNLLFSSVKRLCIVTTFQSKANVLLKSKKANHSIEKIWHGKITSTKVFMMFVSRNSTHASSDSILTRNKDMLDLF